MKVLVTGVKGQLGFDVVKELKKRGYDAVGVDINEMAPHGQLLTQQKTRRIFLRLER